MERTVNVDGIEVSVDPVRLADMDLIEAVCEANDEEEDGFKRIGATVRMFRLVFGDEQYERIKSELRGRSENGVVTIKDLSEFFKRMGEVSQELKN